jgi:hypothetical protein
LPKRQNKSAPSGAFFRRGLSQKMLTDVLHVQQPAIYYSPRSNSVAAQSIGHAIDQLAEGSHES